MVSLNIVRIKDIKKYGYAVKEYGLANEMMANTLVVDFNGVQINIAHGEYEPVADSEFVFSCGRIYKKTYDGLVDTGLKCQ